MISKNNQIYLLFVLIILFINKIPTLSRKHGTTRDVEEAIEVNEEDIEIPLLKVQEKRDIRGGVFGNNWDVDDTSVIDMDREHQTTVVGFTQCLMYLCE